MSDALTQGFLDFFWPVIVSVLAGLLVFSISLPLSADITWTQKRLRFLGIFYNLKVREQLWLAAGMMRVLFVATVMFFWINLQASHISFYLVLCVLSTALFFRVRRLPLDILNAAAIFVAMLVSNLVTGYYWDVSGDAAIWSVSMLLALFVTMYTAYFYLKDICDMLEYRAGRVEATNLASSIEHLRDGGDLG
jgi:hypothetical protein